MKPILIVDDDEGVRTLLRRVIEDIGHTVVEAADATSALEVLQSTKVGLALCDIRMPGRDGVWLMDQILARFPGTPVALATGLLEMDPNVTLRRGVVGYIVKPFNRAAIAELLRVAAEPPPATPIRTIDLTALDAI